MEHQVFVQKYQLKIVGIWSRGKRNHRASVDLKCVEAANAKAPLVRHGLPGHGQPHPRLQIPTSF